MKEIWLKEISAEEERSGKRWEEKEKWLQTYAINYGDPTKQNIPKPKRQRGNQNKSRSPNRKGNNPKPQQNRQSSNSRSRSRSKSNQRKVQNRPKRLFSDVVKVGPKKTNPSGNRKQLAPVTKQKGTKDNAKPKRFLPKPKTSGNAYTRSRSQQRNTRKVYFLGRGQNQASRQKSDEEQTSPKRIEELTQES